MASKPRILIARAIPPEVVRKLEQHFEVESNQDDVVWSPQELAAHLQDKDGVLTTGSQTIDAALLAACPRLKVVANMAVGYNNFDVPAMTAAGVQGTNGARRADRDHGRLRLCPAHGHGPPRDRERALPARRKVKLLALRPVRRLGSARQHAGHHRHGPHRPGHCPARCAWLRHEGGLSQPLAPVARAGSRMQGRLRGQGRTAGHGRPCGAGAALHQGKPPHHRRGRDRKDEAHGHADQHRARWHRR